MNRITVLGAGDGRLTQCFAEIAPFDVQFSDSADASPDTACVLVSQETFGGDLQSAADRLRRRGIPFAALTFDRSDENAEYLLDCGFDRILALPMSAKLLTKHIAALSGSDAGNTEVGLSLLTQLSASDNQRGALIVKESEFSNIYRFVARLQERMDKKAQLIEFTFHTRLHSPPEPGVLEQALPIVQKCLRRGDIVCIYGKQLFAILSSADPDGAAAAADRIVNTYEAYCRDSIFSMQYQMNAIR